MTIVSNYTEPAVAFLFARAGGTLAVSGPRDLPTREQVGTLEPCLIVQAAGGPNPLSPPQRQVLYTVRCYGDSDDDALAVYGAFQAALMDDLAQPISNQLVGGKWWLYRGESGGPAGPDKDPDADWAVVVSTATMVWSMLEV